MGHFLTWCCKIFPISWTSCHWRRCRYPRYVLNANQIVGGISANLRKRKTSTVDVDRSYSKRVVDIPNVGFYSLPKIMGRTGRFIYDGLRLISLGCKQKQKNTNIVQKPNTALVAVGHFPLSPYRLPVGSSANKSLHWGYR